MSNDFLVDIAGETKELTRTEKKVEQPKRYRVLLLNDDYTPMDFVVEILKIFFHFDSSKATQLMLEVHFKGRSVCGVFTRDIAETKVALVNEYAREKEYPLMCMMEPEY